MRSHMHAAAAMLRPEANRRIRLYLRAVVNSVGGDFLRRTRKRQGVSQTELARRVGTHQPQISAWETGAKPIQVEQLAVLLDALGYTLRLEAEASALPHGADPFAAVLGTTRGKPRPRGGG